MSSATDHRHGEPEALAKSRGDPTRTATLRKRYSQKLRGQFGEINTEIRRGVRDRDVFGLSSDGESLAEPLPSQFPSRQDQQIETFDRWLKRQQENGVLDVISRNGNRYVRSAYGRGVEHANTELRKRGMDVPEQELQQLFNRPVHRDTLQLLYTSDYSDLEGITAEVSKQANRALTEGFAEGVGPDEIARRLTDRVDKIGKTRATTLARTSVIDAHSSATLRRFEELGVEEVSGKAEWRTARDRRVCARCRGLDGSVYSIEEAKGMLPRHPRCRCVWLPTVPN